MHLITDYYDADRNELTERIEERFVKNSTNPTIAVDYGIFHINEAGTIDTARAIQPYSFSGSKLMQELTFSYPKGASETGFHCTFDPKMQLFPQFYMYSV